MGIIEVTIPRRKAAMSDIQFPHFSKEERSQRLSSSSALFTSNNITCGTVELVAIEGDEVRVHLGGACEGCPPAACNFTGLGSWHIASILP